MIQYPRTEFDLPPLESHRPLIADFVDSAQKNEDPLVSGEEGSKATRVIDAIYRSSSCGRIIPNRTSE